MRDHENKVHEPNPLHGTWPGGFQDGQRVEVLIDGVSRLGRVVPLQRGCVLVQLDGEPESSRRVFAVPADEINPREEDPDQPQSPPGAMPDLGIE